MPNIGRNITRGARVVGAIGARPPAPRPAPKPKPHKPKPMQPRQPKIQAPKTHTSTLTGTGVNTTSQGAMPGAVTPPSTGMPATYQAPPAIKNWGKATAAQIAQAQLAPEYSNLYTQQHQYNLMSGEQANVIRTYGTDLAKILGESQKGGGALGPDFAAAMTMMSLRQFAYNNFLQSQKFADEYATIAAKYPSMVTAELARRADLKLKQDAFNYQKLVGNQAYGLNVAKTKMYNQKAADQSKQAWARIGISQANAKIAMKRYGLSAGQLQLQIAKENRYVTQYNQKRADDKMKIDYSASRAAGKWVNSFGKPLNIGLKNPIQVGKSSGTSKDAKKAGLTTLQYQAKYGTALKAAQAADKAGVSKHLYITRALQEGIPRSVANKAWSDWKKRTTSKTGLPTNIGG